MNTQELLKTKQFKNVLLQLDYALKKRQFFLTFKSSGDSIGIEIKKIPKIEFNAK